NGFVYLYNNRYGNNKFDTLFNINSQIGNRWRFPLVDTACADSTYFVKVLNIGTKNIQGFNLNWLYVKIGPLDYSGNQTFGYVLDTIIERLGYRYDDIDYAPCYSSTAEGVHGGLRCYSDDTFGFYSTEIVSACDYVTNIVKLDINEKDVKIYPNPVSDKLNIAIDLKQTETATIEIVNVMGKCQYYQILSENNGFTEISIAGLSEGVYFYKIIINNSIIKVDKLSIIR
ncbi:MAG: T9SS type A sorting domain-containing protein, partial [Bacteroidia bacterium]